MSKERRRHPRKAVDVPAEIAPATSAASKLVARCTNISLGGAQLQVAETLDYGTNVDVTLMIGPDESVTLPAITRWIGEGSVGVQFGSLRAKDAYKLAEFVAALPSAEE